MQIEMVRPMIEWKLAQLMLDKDIKTGQLAEATGLHASTISKLKAFREMPKRLDRETLDKLCDALNCDPGDLMKRRRDRP